MISAVLFGGCIVLWSVLALAFAEGDTKWIVVPVLAWLGCLACLWLVYYVSIGPGWSNFPGFTSPSSMVGCAVAVGCVAAVPVAILSFLLWAVIEGLLQPPAPEKPVPRSSKSKRTSSTSSRRCRMWNVSRRNAAPMPKSRRSRPRARSRGAIGELSFSSCPSCPSRGGRVGSLPKAGSG